MIDVCWSGAAMYPGSPRLVVSLSSWVPVDSLQFLRSVRDERGGRTLFGDIIDSVVRDIISGTKLEEIVRSGDWGVGEPDEIEQGRDDVSLTKRPKLGCEKLESEILKSASTLMSDLGIEHQGCSYQAH